jgi:hypothetical protein
VGSVGIFCQEYVGIQITGHPAFHHSLVPEIVQRIERGDQIGLDMRIVGKILKNGGNPVRSYFATVINIKYAAMPGDPSPKYFKA